MHNIALTLQTEYHHMDLLSVGYTKYSFYAHTMSDQTEHWSLKPQGRWEMTQSCSL